MKLAGLSRMSTTCNPYLPQTLILQNRFYHQVSAGSSSPISSVSFLNGGTLLLLRRRRNVHMSQHRRILECKAMVNVEVSSPSLLLGIGLIMAGVCLFGIRRSNRRISKDSDVIISSLVIVTGGALVFQGWRLDPLMLLCQLMTCAVACTFAYETFNLRETQSTIDDVRTAEQFQRSKKQEQDQDEFVYDFNDINVDDIGSELPEPRSSMDEYLYDSEGSNWKAVGEANDFPWDGELDPKPSKNSQNDLPIDENLLKSVEDWE